MKVCVTDMGTIRLESRSSAEVSHHHTAIVDVPQSQVLNHSLLSCCHIGTIPFPTAAMTTVIEMLLQMCQRSEWSDTVIALLLCRQRSGANSSLLAFLHDRDLVYLVSPDWFVPQ